MRSDTIDLSTSRGLRLHALLDGDRDPLVVLAHAASMCAGVWAPVMERLATTATVIAFDARGHGDSDAPTGTAAYRWQEFAADFAAVIRWAETRFGRRVSLAVTHSFSGDCALIACGTETLPIDRMILLDPVFVDQTGASVGGPSLAKATLAAGEREAAGFDSAEAAAAHMERWIGPQLVSGRIDDAARAAFAAWGITRDASGRHRFKCRRDSEAEIYRNRLAIVDSLAPLSPIPQSVEVVFAEKRRMRPGEDGEAVRTRDLAQTSGALARCRAGTRTDMPGVGHFLLLENPRAVSELLAHRLGTS